MPKQLNCEITPEIIICIHTYSRLNTYFNLRREHQGIELIMYYRVAPQTAVNVHGNICGICLCVIASLVYGDKNVAIETTPQQGCGFSFDYYWTAKPTASNQRTRGFVVAFSSEDYI